MRTVAQKIEAVEWAIHSANKQITQIRENEMLTSEQKVKQEDAHQSYLRSLFAIREKLISERNAP